MKTKIKQIVSLTVILIMVMTLFAGCKKESGEDEWISDVVYETVDENGNPVDNSNTDSKNKSKNKNKTNSNTNSQSNSSTKKSSNTSNPFNYNLGGKTINIYGSADRKNINASENKSNAATVAMFEKLEKQLNCKIVYSVYETQELYQQVMLKIASGSYFADLIDARIFTAEGYIVSGFTKDLSKISTVDLSKDYMNIVDGVEGFQYGSGHWAIAEPLSNAGVNSPVFVNKRILKEITGNENYVYDLMSKKQWNISNFRDLAKKAVKDLDGVSGLSKADRAGIIQLDPGTYGAGAVLASLGVDLVTKENGKIKYNMQNASVTSAIDLIYDIYVKDGTCITANDDGCIDLFRTGHGLFYNGGYLGQLIKIADMDDEFGLVPFPAKDSSSNYRMATNMNYFSLMIPSNLDDSKTKDAGAFLQAYCYAAQDAKKARFDECANRYLCDAQSRKNIDICFDAMRVTTSTVVCNSSLADIFNGTYRVVHRTLNGESAPALIQSTSKVAIAAIDDLNKKFK